MLSVPLQLHRSCSPLASFNPSSHTTPPSYLLFSILRLPSHPPFPVPYPPSPSHNPAPLFVHPTPPPSHNQQIQPTWRTIRPEARKRDMHGATWDRCRYRYSGIVCICCVYRLWKDSAVQCSAYVRLLIRERKGRGERGREVVGSFTSLRVVQFGKVWRGWLGRARLC